MSTAKILAHFSKIRHFSLSKRNFTVGKIVFNKKSDSNVNIPSVQGLSERCLKVASEPVGPGASKTSKHYQNPEYFCYDKNSYFEAEVEMLKHRCPQPSSSQHYEHTK